MRVSMQVIALLLNNNNYVIHIEYKLVVVSTATFHAGTHSRSNNKHMFFYKPCTLTDLAFGMM